MTYTLLDSGNGEKLEQFGPYTIVRQANQAIWRKSLPKQTWLEIAGKHNRKSQGGGDWQWFGTVPDEWIITYGDIKFRIHPTEFGHMGIFPEQKNNGQKLLNATLIKISIY